MSEEKKQDTKREELSQEELDKVAGGDVTESLTLNKSAVPTPESLTLT